MRDFDWTVLLKIGLWLLLLALIVTIVVFFISSIWTGDERLAFTAIVLVFVSVTVGGFLGWVMDEW